MCSQPPQAAADGHWFLDPQLQRRQAGGSESERTLTIRFCPLPDRSIRRRSRRVLRASRVFQHHLMDEAELVHQALLGRECFERLEVARPDSVAEALLQPGEHVRRTTYSTSASYASRRTSGICGTPVSIDHDWPRNAPSNGRRLSGQLRFCCSGRLAAHENLHRPPRHGASRRCPGQGSCMNRSPRLGRCVR